MKKCDGIIKRSQRKQFLPDTPKDCLLPRIPGKPPAVRRRVPGTDEHQTSFPVHMLYPRLKVHPLKPAGKLFVNFKALQSRQNLLHLLCTFTASLVLLPFDGKIGVIKRLWNSHIHPAQSIDRFFESVKTDRNEVLDRKSDNRAHRPLGKLPSSESKGLVDLPPLIPTRSWQRNPNIAGDGNKHNPFLFRLHTHHR